MTTRLSNTFEKKFALWKQPHPKPQGRDISISRKRVYNNRIIIITDSASFIRYTLQLLTHLYFFGIIYPDF